MDNFSYRLCLVPVVTTFFLSSTVELFHCLALFRSNSLMMGSVSDSRRSSYVQELYWVAQQRTCSLLLCVLSCPLVSSRTLHLVICFSFQPLGCSFVECLRNIYSLGLGIVLFYHTFMWLIAVVLILVITTLQYLSVTSINDVDCCSESYVSTTGLVSISGFPDSSYCIMAGRFGSLCSWST